MRHAPRHDTMHVVFSRYGHASALERSAELVGHTCECGVCSSAQVAHGEAQLLTRVEPERDGEDDIQTHEDHALEPVAKARTAC